MWKRVAVVIVVAVVVLLGSGVAYVAFLLVRPLATRHDVSWVLATALNADAALASQVCGEKVEAFLSPTPKISELKYGEWPWADVSLDSWRPLLPKEGTISAHVSGVGVDHDQKPLTPMRRARISFPYRCDWEDNGRSMHFYCRMTAKPTVVRD